MFSIWVRGTGSLVVTGNVSNPPLLPLPFPLKVLQCGLLAASWRSRHTIVHCCCFCCLGFRRANNRFQPSEIAVALPPVLVSCTHPQGAKGTWQSLLLPPPLSCLGLMAAPALSDVGQVVQGSLPAGCVRGARNFSETVFMPHAGQYRVTSSSTLV